MIKQILINAKKIIEDKNNWTQGSIAQDINGHSVGFTNPKACKFCVMGAIYKAAADNDNINLIVRDGKIFTDLKKIWGIWPADLNDTITHEELMIKLDQAISLVD